MSAELNIPADEAYDLIDRFLRNNLDDADYAHFSDALEVVRAPGAPQEAVKDSLTTQAPWHTAVLAECMLTEACYQEADPAATVRALIDWHVANTAAVPAVGQEADAFPFYELRFIMRVLSHKGRAPEQDWETAHGMAKEIFQKWHAAALAGGDGGEG